MPLTITHSTPADGTFSAAGAVAWDDDHSVAGQVDLTTDVTGVLPTANGGTGYAVRPAFLAYKTANQTDITGAGTIAAVTWDAEAFDVGSNFATNTFTAPVTGKYQFSIGVRFSGMTAAADSCVLYLITSNSTYLAVFSKTNDMPVGIGMALSVLADMDANDTATISVQANGEATDVVDVLFGSTGNLQSWFSGSLTA